ncbi:MAG: hypothetical protein NDI91_13560 [Sulfuritalea sp.]|nr:hypothetical protein [Sulfuritalea sp.]
MIEAVLDLFRRAKIATNMLIDGPTLYHGSTVGWLHLSGFGKADFAFGEFAAANPFIYLCTQREGGDSAACKAFVQVYKRHINKPPLAEYCFRGTPFAIDRYVYHVTCKAQVNVLDLHAESLDEVDMKRVKQVIANASKSRLKSISTSFDLCLKPITWRNHLEAAFVNQRDEMVHALGRVGFQLIRNFERDGDGQEYGEVWALPMNQVACVTLQPPAIYKIA